MSRPSRDLPRINYNLDTASINSLEGSQPFEAMEGNPGSSTQPEKDTLSASGAVLKGGAFPSDCSRNREQVKISSERETEKSSTPPISVVESLIGKLTESVQMISESLANLDTRQKEMENQITNLTKKGGKDLEVPTMRGGEESSKFPYNYDL